MSNIQHARNYWLHRLLPFMKWWHMVDRNSTRADMIAGITGAMIVLPQGVAFATIAGMPPEYGLYAAMLPAIIAALFGSSWHLVSGPTTAISIAVFAAMSPLADPGSPQFISMVLTLTFLTGLFQLILGLGAHGGAGQFHLAHRGHRLYGGCGTAHRGQPGEEFLRHRHRTRCALPCGDRAVSSSSSATSIPRSRWSARSRWRRAFWPSATSPSCPT